MILFDQSDFERKLFLLKEREKELKCLYKVHEIISENLPLDAFFMEIVKHIWGGWQYPVILKVKIVFEGRVYKEEGWTETEWKQSSDIMIDETVSGKIEVFYTNSRTPDSGNLFLPEEQKLLNTIAANIGSYIFSKKLLKTIETIEIKGAKPSGSLEDASNLLPVEADFHWKWRSDMVGRIAEKLDFDAFGVEALYLIGSAKKGTSGPASDIDLLVHFTGNRDQERALRAWFEGWSLCLSEINFLKTGYRSSGLIDLHLITQRDIEKKDSFASMIGSATNSARLIKSRG